MKRRKTPFTKADHDLFEKHANHRGPDLPAAWLTNFEATRALRELLHGVPPDLLVKGVLHVRQHFPELFSDHGCAPAALSMVLILEADARLPFESDTAFAEVCEAATLWWADPEPPESQEVHGFDVAGAGREIRQAVERARSVTPSLARCYENAARHLGAAEALRLVQGHLDELRKAVQS
jgi:hypothetical protein